MQAFPDYFFCADLIKEFRTRVKSSEPRVRVVPLLFYKTRTG